MDTLDACMHASTFSMHDLVSWYPPRIDSLPPRKTLLISELSGPLQWILITSLLAVPQGSG
jgi:hypothetical protein